MFDRRVRNQSVLGLAIACSLLIYGSNLWAQSGSHGLVALPSAASSHSLFDDENLHHVAELASELSFGRNWLNQDIYKRLRHTSLGLDEIFTGAPEFVVINGLPYRPKVEVVDKRWKLKDLRGDSFVVYLARGVVGGLDENQWLAFKAGRQLVLYEEEFSVLPAIGITFCELSPAAQFLSEEDAGEDITLMDLESVRSRIILNSKLKESEKECGLQSALRSGLVSNFATRNGVCPNSLIWGMSPLPQWVEVQYPYQVPVLGQAKCPPHSDVCGQLQAVSGEVLCVCCINRNNLGGSLPSMCDYEAVRVPEPPEEID